MRRWLLTLILLGPILLLVGGTLLELAYRYRVGPVTPIPPAAGPALTSSPQRQ